MNPAKIGDTVKVHYTGRLDDGTVFDSSEGREPLEFTLGEGEVIPGFEAGVVGMKSGETRTIRIAAAQAYGLHHADRVVTMDRAEFPSYLLPAVGKMVEIRQPNGPAIPVRIADISETSVTLDGNHPLAGQDLTFEAQLVAIT